MKTNEDIYYFETREEWRLWLTNHFETSTGIWIIFPLKSTVMKCVLYNDAVEEARCFDWIDSTTKSLDNLNRMQRFTPRNPKSIYSQANKERLRWLFDNKMIHPKIRHKIETLLSESFIFPEDIVDQLKADTIVWNNYQQFSDSYKRIRIAYIESARKLQEEFHKRLRHFIQKTKENKQIKGFGGIEKYY